MRGLTLNMETSLAICTSNNPQIPEAAIIDSQFILQTKKNNKKNLEKMKGNMRVMR